MSDADTLAAALGLDATDPSITDALDQAGHLISDRIGANTYAMLAGGIRSAATVEVAGGLIRRIDNLPGSSQFAEPGNPGQVRGPRDPLATVWPMLAVYAGPGIG